MAFVFSLDVVRARQTRLASALDQVLQSDEWVIVESGLPVTKPGGLDQTYSFMAHPDYYWSTGLYRAAGVIVYHSSQGFIEFVEPTQTAEKVWEGAEDFLLEHRRPLSDWPQFYQGIKGKLIQWGAQGDQQLLSDRSVNPHRFLEVREAFLRVRRVKDQAEVELVKSLSKMAARGYEKIRQVICEGMSERHLQLSYEHEVFWAGADKMPYDTIVGAGERSAILHALPTHRRIKKNEFVLVDAGADLHDYCVDITRVFMADSQMNAQQKWIYELVLKAQHASFEKCRAGVEWHDVHRASAQVFAQGLLDSGLAKGSVDEILESQTVGLFFPHGVGHMVGLRVRDVGTSLLRTPGTVYGTRVRVDQPLEVGHMMTVEPGFYFIPQLLEQAKSNIRQNQILNWAELEKWKHLGGVRLEDDILINEAGFENLTSHIPK